MFSTINFQEILSAFIVLFAVIDIIGSIPIIINIKQGGRQINAFAAAGLSFLLMIIFFFAGEVLLKLFQVDIASFAVAGAFIIFLMSLEMILDNITARDQSVFRSLFESNPYDMDSEQSEERLALYEQNIIKSKQKGKRVRSSA